MIPAKRTVTPGGYWLTAEIRRGASSTAVAPVKSLSFTVHACRLVKSLLAQKPAGSSKVCLSLFMPAGRQGLHMLRQGTRPVTAPGSSVVSALVALSTVARVHML